MPKRADRIAREQARAAEIDENKPEAPSEFKIGDFVPGQRVHLTGQIGWRSPAQDGPIAVILDGHRGHVWVPRDAPTKPTE